MRIEQQKEYHERQKSFRGVCSDIKGGTIISARSPRDNRTKKVVQRPKSAYYMDQSTLDQNALIRLNQESDQKRQKSNESFNAMSPRGMNTARSVNGYPTA